MFQLQYSVTSTLLLFISSIVIINGNLFDYEFNDTDFSKGLPQKSDLGIYLKSLRRILYFCSKHKYDLDLNFEFGLFLTSVNLKKALNSHVIRRVPNKVLQYMILLLNQNDGLIEFFGNMVEQNHDPKERSNKMITSLFSNQTQWIHQLSKFESVLLKDTPASNQRLEEIPSLWHEYEKSVIDLDQWIPHPQLSDKCMASLASNKVHGSDYSTCKVYSPCYDMLTNGTNFGYALSHRLLFLLNAKHGRGCSIFSKTKDKTMTKEFCTTAFSEARFISFNNYGDAIDLFLEQMCLCALSGYPQFLQRSWIHDILYFQTPYGCFGQDPYRDGGMTVAPILSRHPRTWKLAKHRDHTIMDGLCDGHVTSVAAATLATAVRYILETYY